AEDSPAPIPVLHAIVIRTADLGGATLGPASGHTVWLDANAASWGWFVDPTPADDSEFTTPGNQGEQGRIDRVTGLVHELRSLLGYDHAAGGGMAEPLTAGARRIPGADPLAPEWVALDPLAAAEAMRRILVDTASTSP